VFMEGGEEELGLAQHLGVPIIEQQVPHSVRLHWPDAEKMTYIAEEHDVEIAAVYQIFRGGEWVDMFWGEPSKKIVDRDDVYHYDTFEFLFRID